MAGTEDYSFYCSIENSPFWIRKPDEAASVTGGDGNPYNNERKTVNDWERKLITPPKYATRKLLMLFLLCT